jgi:hypothetical protein
MARPEFLKNRKLARAVAILQQPRALVVGCMELLWHSAYETGNAVVGDTTDVELQAEWPGEKGVLVAALLKCGGDGPGLIEEVPGKPGRYQIHDFHEGAPSYVKDRWRKQDERRLKKARGSLGDSEKAPCPGRVPDASVTRAPASTTPLPSPPLKTKKAMRSSAPADGAPRKIVLEFARGFKERVGTDPVIAWSRDMKLAKQLLAGRPEDEACKIAYAFGKAPPRWNEDSGAVNFKDIFNAANSILQRLKEEGSL